LTEPLRRTGLFPPLALHMLHVGEESGHLNEMLLRVADVYDGEVERAVERLLTLLVPVVTLGLGLIIAVIIASILVAILSINDLAFV
jgi:Type II secretory pathway, component PulF